MALGSLSSFITPKNIAILALTLVCGFLYIKTVSLKGQIVDREREVLAAVTVQEELKTQVGQLEFDKANLNTKLSLRDADFQAVKAALDGSQKQVTKLTQDSDYWYHKARKFEKTVASIKEVPATDLIAQASVVDIPSSNRVIDEYNSTVSDLNSGSKTQESRAVLPTLKPAVRAAKYSAPKAATNIVEMASFHKERVTTPVAKPAITAKVSPSDEKLSVDAAVVLATIFSGRKAEVSTTKRMVVGSNISDLRRDDMFISKGLHVRTEGNVEILTNVTEESRTSRIRGWSAPEESDSSPPGWRMTA
jgi:outer membrane murein-binding lipoprotein Lpp